MVNRYYTAKPFTGQFYTPPVEMLSQVLEQAQKQYDNNYQIADALRSRTINAMDADKPRAREIQAETEKRIDDVVKMYNGDYSRATGELRKLVSDVRKQYGANSEVGAIEQNYAAYNDWLTGEKKRVSEGKITADDLSYAHNYYLNNYKGAGTPDPITGNYNRFMPEQLAEYTDGSKLVTEALSKVKPRKFSRKVMQKNAQGEWFSTEVEQEGINPDDAKTAVAAALTSDNKWMDYSRQAASLRGLDPNEYLLAQIDAYQQTYVPLMAGTISDKQSYEYRGLDDREKLRIQHQNALGQISARERSQKRLIDYKHKLDNPELYGEGTPGTNLQRLATNPVSDFKKLKLSNLQMTNGTIQPKDSGLLSAAMQFGLGVVGGPLSIGAMQNEGVRGKLGLTTTKKAPSVKDILDKGAPGVNMALFQDIAKKNQGRPDSDIVALYNEALKREANRSIFFEPNLQPQQQQAAADQLIPRYINSGAKVYKLEGNKFVKLSGDQASSVLSSSYDFSKRKANGVITGTTRGYTGEAPVGHLLQTASGTYVIADQSPLMELYNGDDDAKSGLRHKAFGHISSGSKYSDVFQVPSPDGKGMVPTVGVLSYDKNGFKQVNYYPAQADESGKVIPETINYLDPWRLPDGKLMGAMNMEDQLAGPEINFIRQRQKLSANPKTNPGYNYDLMEQNADNQ